MRILSVVGARPEFIQALPVSRALRALQKHHEILVHTGQHYDYRMSQTFFDELGIPAPDYNLEVGSGSHGRQTADVLTRMEEVLLKERPDLVIVRGDTNSTLASALAASKLHVPVAHIEAGERCYDRRMPEEINRLVTDRVSDVHFSDHVHLVEPVGYFDMMMLEESARLIATDSGGVQREAYFLGVPCLTLRDETEWIETVEAGWNQLVGAEPTKVLDAWFSFAPPAARPPIFGDGTAGQRIAQILDAGVFTSDGARGHRARLAALKVEANA